MALIVLPAADVVRAATAAREAMKPAATAVSIAKVREAQLLAAPTDLVPTARVPTTLRDAGLTDRPVSYGVAYRAIISGVVPAEQLPNGRWAVRRADLPQLAKAMGLTPAAPVPVAA